MSAVHVCTCGQPWPHVGLLPSRDHQPAPVPSLVAPTRPQSVSDALVDAATLEEIARHHCGDGLFSYRMFRAGQCGRQAVERLGCIGCDELAALDATAAATAAFAAIPELRPEEER